MDKRILMRMLPIPSQELLLELFNYDPETGILTWRKSNATMAYDAAAVDHFGEFALTNDRIAA